MKTETYLKELQEKLFAKTETINSRCNEIGTGEEKTQLLKDWSDINAQMNLLNHIIYNLPLKSLA